MGRSAALAPSGDDVLGAEDEVCGHAVLGARPADDDERRSGRARDPGAVLDEGGAVVTGSFSCHLSLWSRSTRWPNIPRMGETILPLVHITGVSVIGDHELRLLFEDGTVGDVSFREDPLDGVFAPLRDPARFAKVTVAHGTLYWPDDELDWAPESLYQAAIANPLAPPMAENAG